jgi:hypothetical protein
VVPHLGERAGLMVGWFDPDLREDSWFDPDLVPEGWFDREIIPTAIVAPPEPVPRHGFVNFQDPGVF